MINLVPPKIKQEGEAQKLGRLITSGLFSLLMIVIITSGVIYYADWTLEQKNEKTKNQLVETNTEISKYKDVEDAIAKTNGKISSLSEANKTKILWSNIVIELSNTTPVKVQIKTMSLNDGKRVSLTGIAASRTDIAKFKDNMESSEYFKNVTFTSSSLDQTSGSFTFNLSCELEKTE